MLTRRYFILGALCCEAIIIYGSLVPFQLQPLSLSELVQQFSAVCSTPIRSFSRSDFLANVLLFVPFSFLTMGSFLYGQSKRGWLYLIPVTLVCVLFGACIECLQLMFPPRSASLSDILAQSIGAASGAFLWMLAGPSLSNQFNNLTGRWDGSHRLIRFVPLYLLMIVILETAPFDFTLSPVELVHKWREGRIGVIPFVAFDDTARNMMTKSLWNIVLFLPIGLLIGLNRNLHGTKVAWMGLLIASGLELIQLFVLSRYFEPTDIVTGTLAIWLGWWLMHLHSTFIGERESLHTTRNIRSLLLMVWLIVVLAINWYPFNFTMTGAMQRLSEVSLVPFADYQQKHYLSAFDDIIHKLLLFVLLGLLLSANRSRKGIVVAGMGALISTVVELGQVLLPGRYPSISDVTLSFAASLTGYGLVSAYRATGQPMIQLRIEHQA